MNKKKMIEIIQDRALKKYGEEKLKERMEKTKEILSKLEGNKFYDNIEFVLDYCWQHTPENFADDVDKGVALDMLVADAEQGDYTEKEKEAFDDITDDYYVSDVVLAKWQLYGDI